MNQWEECSDFDWLPGFREMVACQQNESEEGTAQSAGSGVSDTEEGKTILPPEELQQEEQAYWKEYEYMTRLLPSVAREIWAVVEAMLDRYEYEGSFMYAEYPDKNSILKIVDAVYDKMKYYECNTAENKVDGSEGKNCYYMAPEDRGIQTPLRHLIHVILCWNMSYRRQRYNRRKKVFPVAG
ncbi:MAG: hypothetical protein LUF92_04325 [Clostridiales bacterium]|nr:hypothetical protein [Clostridiales bacterium]